MGELWERQEYDTAKSYQAFCDYRDMGVTRSLRILCDHYIKQSSSNTQAKAPTKKESTLFTWSATGNWQERVKAWDAHQQALVEKEHEAARKQIIEDELADYRLELDKWRVVFDRTKLHERRSRVAEKGHDDKPTGNWIELVEMEISDWYQLSKWRDEIAKQGRRALGMPDKIERKENTGKDGGAIETVHKHTFDPSKMTDEELDDFIAKNSGST